MKNNELKKGDIVVLVTGVPDRYKGMLGRVDSVTNDPFYLYPPLYYIKVEDNSGTHVMGGVSRSNLIKVENQLPDKSKELKLQITANKVLKEKVETTKRLNDRLQAEVRGLRKEQRRVVDHLNDAENYIEQLQKTIDNYEMVKDFIVYMHDNTTDLSILREHDGYLNMFGEPLGTKNIIITAKGSARDLDPKVLKKAIDEIVEYDKQLKEEEKVDEGADSANNYLKAVERAAQEIFDLFSTIGSDN